MTETPAKTDDTDDQPAGGPAGPEGGGRSSAIEWDDAAMQTAFANVVNIQGTREQFELFFGVNRSWQADADGPMTVELSNRMILTPLAAKRMWSLLTNVLREYEARHGALKIDA